jgi:inorganic phosphate transporter, PiT family
MDVAFFIVALVVVLGLIFEFVNGFHDAANAIATVVATRVLSLQAAVAMAAILNFVGAVSGTAVATTVGKGLVDAQAVTQGTVAIALFTAIAWDLLTWYFGLPTSSSHALLFAVLGASVAMAGPGVVVLSGLEKVLIGLVYSPLFGLLGGGLIMIAIYWIFRRVPANRVSGLFGRLQLVSSAYMAFSHGGNDGQKTMGIIALALFSYGALGTTFYIPTWVMIAAAIGMAAGTLFGGWRIIKTMGVGLVHLQPVNGFAAETAAGTVIEVATRLGMPISTTHAISGAILGVGSVRSARNVRWGVAGNIVAAWVFTLPTCFAAGWLLMTIARLIQQGATSLGLLPGGLG